MKECPQGLLNEIVGRLVAALRPARVYLFGSHATGHPHKDSDLDFLVVVPDTPTPPRELAHVGRMSLWGMRVPVDLLVCTASEFAKWSTAHCNLIHTVACKGKLLYAS